LGSGWKLKNNTQSGMNGLLWNSLKQFNPGQPSGDILFGQV